MYNGIGLPTPRGTATNGFVQRNLGYKRNRSNKREIEEIETPKVRKPNKDILEHQRKRYIELKLVEWAEENNIYKDNNDKEAENIINEKRKEFILLHEQGKLQSNEDNHARDTHQRSLAKEKENERFRKAMRIEQDYEVGDAFKEDYQQNKKDKRYNEMLERKKKQILYEKEKKQKQIQYNDSRSSYYSRRSRRTSPPYERKRERPSSRSPSPRERKRRRLHSPNEDYHSTSPIITSKRDKYSSPPNKNLEKHERKSEYSSRSPRRYRKDSRSPTRRYPRSPSPMRNRRNFRTSSKSPKRTSKSPSPRRNRKSPFRRYSQSPSPKRTSRSPSPRRNRRNSKSPLRRDSPL